MSDICLVRRDFFDRPEMIGLASDYRVLLAVCSVHPRRNSSGVLHFSSYAARLVGFEHSAAVEGLKVLAARGLVYFDETTLEVFPADFFEVNPPGASRFSKAGEVAATRILSPTIKEAWQWCCANAGKPVPSFAVPLNLVSALAPRGGQVMRSDASIALALYLNPFLSPVGIGIVNYEALAELTAQTADAAKTGFANVVARGIADVDLATGEYRLVRWLGFPGKLRRDDQIRDAVLSTIQIESRRLKNASKRELERLLHTKFAELTTAFAKKSVTCSVPLPYLTLTTPPPDQNPTQSQPPATPEAGGGGGECSIPDHLLEHLEAAFWVAERAGHPARNPGRYQDKLLARWGKDGSGITQADRADLDAYRTAKAAAALRDREVVERREAEQKARAEADQARRTSGKGDAVLAASLSLLRQHAA